MHGTADGLPTLHPEFAALWLKTINDIPSNPPHQLFHQFWAYIPDQVRDAYLAQFRATQEGRQFLDEKWFPPEAKAEDLRSLPKGSLGRTVYDHLVDHNLTVEIALNYKLQQQKWIESGLLDRMPDDFRYIQLRRFQTHDIEHIVTGLLTTPSGEIALQAFGLAQLGTLYQAIWVSTVCTRMAYLEPQTINRLMNAITLGWELGKKNPNLLYIRWENHFAEPLEAVRRRYGIVPVEPERLEPARLAA